MSNLSLRIMELLGMSLGVRADHYKQFFEENESIMRLNYYPPCQRPDQTLGTGPHCDPTSLTILHQDTIGGLQVFVDDEWRSINPNPDAFVVNIGDTFMVINGDFSLNYEYYNIYAYKVVFCHLADHFLCYLYVKLFNRVHAFSKSNSKLTYILLGRHFQMGGTEAVCIEQW